MKANEIDVDPTVDVFSRPATVKILIVFLDIGGECSAREIIDASGVSDQTFYDNVEVLQEYGLVERTGKIGNTTMYRTAFENDAVKAFQQFRQALEQ